MRKTFKIFFISGIMILFTHCGQNADDNHDHSHTEKAKEHSQANETILRLDDGKLWQANAETTAGIDNMKNLIRSFSDRESLAAYTLLKENLVKEFGLIFKNCTMTGEAHNQLHNYMLPMKDMLDGIGSSDLEDCQANLDNLDHYLSDYPKFFK